MTDPPIFRRLLDDVLDDIEHHLHHHQPPASYDQPRPEVPEEPPMSLATFEASIRNDIQAGMDKAADVYNHLKTVAEQRLPELAALQASPVAQAIEGVVLPPEIEAELTTLVQTYARRFGTAPAAADTPAGADAEQDTAAPAPADPVPAPAQ